MFRINSFQNFAKNKCIISRDSKNDSILYYEQVIAAIKKICEKFKELRVCSTDCFAVKLKDGITAGSISLLLAILNEGSFFCPLSQYDESIEEFKEFMRSCKATFLVSNIELQSKDKHFQEIAKLNIFEEKFYLYSVQHSVPKDQLPENMCYTIGTSGSTGRPKIVHVPFQCIEPNIKALCERFKVCCDDVIFLGTPMTFDPFVVELFMALSCGATLLVTSSKLRLNAQNLADILWTKNPDVLDITILQTTPSLFRLFGVETIRDVILAKNSALRILILGGEEFPKCIELKKWLPPDCLLDKRIFNIYGITELSCWSTIHELNATEIIENNSIPLGDSIDDETSWRVETVEKNLENVIGGELLVVGSASRKTYIPIIDNDYKTQNENQILYRDTGDLVERKNGKIFYLGRLNNVIKRFGKRINLDILEQKIENMFPSDDLLKAICLWNTSTQALFCCLSRKADLKMSDAKRLIMNNLSNHEKPDWILEIEQFPLNWHGKIDRKKILQLLEATIKNPVDIFRRFLVETLTLNIVETISTNASMSKRFKKDECNNNSMTKSFTSLGGTSFNALSLATEIGSHLSNPNDARQLLEKLLDSNIAVSDVLGFLENAPICKNFENSKEESVPTQSEKYLDFIWRIDMEKCIDATPSVNVDQRYICIGSHAHLLLTIDCSAGREKCRLKLNSRIECEVAFFSKDLGLVGCNAGYLYAFNFLTGVLCWSMYIGTKVKAKPLIISDAIHAIIGCYDEKWNLVYVCLKTQQMKWRKKVGTKPIFSSPICLDNRTALICTLDGTYERLEISTGNSYWTRKCATPIFSTPAIVENELTFGIAEVGGKVHICAIENGDTLQSFSVDGNIFSNLTICQYDSVSTNKEIIFGCHDQHVYCLGYGKKEHEAFNPNKVDCYLKWKTKLESAIYAKPEIAELHDTRFVIVCGTKGSLNVLEANGGLLIATYQLKGEIFSSPSCVRNTNNELHIYFGCRDNYLYCFRFHN